MLKNLTTILATVLLTMAIANSALAAFADLELIRIYYDRAGDEIATDLGNVKTILADPQNPYVGSFGSLATTSYVVYFALYRTTNELWASGRSTSSVIQGGSTGLTGMKSGTTNVYSLYNIKGGTNYTGPSSEANSYMKKLSPNGQQGSLGNAINFVTRVDTEASLSGLIGASSGLVTQTLYYWANGLTTVTAEKTGKAVATITTSFDGSTTITPLPKVDGACGSSNGQTFVDKQALVAKPTTDLCSPGTPTTITGTDTGPWSWDCMGQGVAGTKESCSATLQPQSFIISSSVVGGNGTISCVSPVNNGASSDCTISPDPGFHLATITDEGADVLSSVTVNNSYTISNIIANHNIVGSFAADAKTTPVITWPQPDSITYGTPLSATQLNATANVPGSFAYIPTEGSLLNAGTDQTLSVTFTQNDPTKYTTQTAEVKLTVNKALLTVTANSFTRSVNTDNPVLTLTYSGFENGDTAASLTTQPTAGTTATTVSPVGTYPITASGGVSSNYTFNYVDGTLTVTSKTLPLITWATPAAITYGTPLSVTQLNATANVPGTFAYIPTEGSLLNAGTDQTLSVTFTPTDKDTYSSDTRSVKLTVNKAVPTITWNTPTPINYGTALSTTQLNATGSIPGTFMYSPTAGSILSTGNRTLTATFTPTDTRNYTIATASVSLTVNTAVLSITWATPAAITYGTALSSTQLNATANTTGTYAYSPDSGSVLNAGTHTLSVIFTPTDTINYSPAGFTVNLTVNKATPVITWNPAAINTNTPLSITQLNATANATGTFNYSPAAGTLLPAGANTLSVTFTPTDSLNYNNQTATTNLTVNTWYPSGALDGSATPTIIDAMKVLKSTVGLVTLTDAERKNADVAPLALVKGILKPEPNGKIDAADALLILKRNLGIISW